MKKVLMVTYSFPPKGGGGVLRQLKFAKYLPQFNWQPYILTGCGGISFCFQDKHLLEGLPGSCRIFQSLLFDPRRFIGTRKNLKFTPHYSIGLSGFLVRLLNKLSIPDIYAIWAPQALYTALKIIKEHNIDVIYSIDNPYSNHLVGLILKKITRLPWVIDFKDPWSNNWSYSYEKIMLLKLLERKLEKEVVNKSDICISVNEFILNSFKQFDLGNTDKFYILTNGYDFEDFIGLGFKKLRKEFIITYTGTLHRDYFPREFFRALDALIADGSILKNDIRFVFVGLHAFHDIRNDFYYQRLLKMKVIEELGQVTHKDSIRHLITSDILLLGSARTLGSDYIIPSKAYEYLASGTMILALTYDGSFLMNLIKGMDSGWTAPFDDVQAIKKSLLGLYGLFKSNKLPRFNNDGKLEIFERRNLTRKLAELFDKAYEVNSN